MRVSFFHSLAVRLAGLILILCGLTLLILTELNRRAVERILLQQAEIQAVLSTHSVVDGLDAVIGAVERMTRFVARDLEGRAMTPQAAERVARHLLLDNPNVYGCSIALEARASESAPTRLGVFVHRSNVVSQYVTQDLTTPEQAFWTRDWYREVIDKAQPIWSEPYFDRGGTDRNVVRLAVPIVRAGEQGPEPVGAVAVVIELEWLRRLANVNEFSDTSFTLIFSRSGRLIIHPKPHYVIAETIESLAEKEHTPELTRIRQNVIARRQGEMRYREPLADRRVHVNYKPTKAAGWGVIVGFAETEFLQTQREFRIITAVFLGSLLVLLTGIVVLVAHFALRPLTRLDRAANEIAARNLECDIPPARRKDEVGRLTDSFRRMREALAAQQLERRWAKQALEHQLHYSRLIIDSISELVFVLTRALNVSRVNPAVLRSTGFTSPELIKAPLARVVRLLPRGGAAEALRFEDLAGSLRQGHPIHDTPVAVICKDGAEFRGLLTMVPLRDGNQIVGAVVTIRPPAAGVE